MTQKHMKHFLWPQARNHDFLKSGLLSLLLFLGLQVALASETENLDNPKTAVFQSSVSGTVTDDTGAPLPGASIVEKGTTNGTQTDFDGNYTINVDSGATLVISYIGYATQEIPVNGQATINVTLQEDASELDEVVLVGYGTQSRVAVTNAISSVTSEDLVETPAIGVEQALQGRAAGVQVTNRGTPGAAPLVTIRGLGTFGNNQPLFIVDGVPTTNLNNIPAEAIESVDILKDASSAAIYGSRASNGVVLIKTKGGKKGRTSFRASTYAGLSTIPKTLDVLNADQYRQYASEAYDADPVVPGNQIYPGLQPGNFDPAVSTDYQDEILRTGLWQNYDIEASGGSETATYSVRLGYLQQEGALIESQFDRYSVGLNTSIDLSDKITMGQTLNLGISRRFGGDGGTILGNATRFDPTRPVFDDETNFYSEITTSFNGQDIENPVRLRENGEFLTSQTSIVGSVFGSYEIIPGLTYKLTIGLDHSFTNQDNFEPSIPTGSRTRLFSETRDNRQRNLSTVVTNTLNYNTTINDKHNLDVLAGYERNRTVFDRIDAFTINPLTDNVENLNPNEVENLTSSENENNLQSVFGRIGYDFDRTFFLSGTLRADGSSRFAPGNQWGYFPSVSGAVNLANLPFLQDSENLSALKLRASWGITGNNNIGNYQFQTGLLTDFNYVIDGTLVSGTRPARIPNEQLQWEELTSLNIGADVAFFNNALTITGEYFRNESDGLLVSVPLPSSLGATDATQFQNVGGTELTGLEFTIGYKDFEGDFTWGANFNAFVALNQEVTSLGSVDAIFQGNWFQQFHTRLTEGEAPFHFFGLRTDGIFQNQAEVDAHATQNNAEPGNIRYVDTNNDGAINADDRVVIGNPNPDLQLGADFNFKYKNLDFSVFLVGEYGKEIYNGFRLTLEQQARLFNMSTVVLDRWSPTNPSQTIPKATPGFTGNEQVSDRFIEDGSFTRVRQMTLGYTLPSKVLSNFANGSISRLRFYISGQNLITFTDYSGYDPEIVPLLADANNNVSANGTNVNSVGLDQGRFPQPRTVLAGLQIDF